MRTYISDIIPKIQKFSQKLDNLTLLTNQHWVVINEIDNAKNVYIFRPNNELLISQNGKVEKAKWEYLGNNSLLIDRKDESYLFKHGFFDENILALKIDGRNEYAFFVNETKFDGELNSLENVYSFLNEKYIEPKTLGLTGVVIDNIAPKKLSTYVAPSHIRTKISENDSWLYGKIEKFIIDFEDNINGEIYFRFNDNKAYFKGKPDGLWVNITCVYDDIESCINALHYYLKTKNLLSDGLYNTF